MCMEWGAHSCPFLCHFQQSFTVPLGSESKQTQLHSATLQFCSTVANIACAPQYKILPLHEPVTVNSTHQ